MVIVHHFKTVDSTNDWAKRHYQEFDCTQLTVIVAEGQTAGRGRFNRRWISPAGQNLYVTFCFFTANNVANISQVIGTAVARLFPQLRLKWPNDLVSGGSKVGGILCETLACEQGVCVLAGLGLNVNMPPEHFAEIDQPATSLSLLVGRFLEVTDVTDQVIAAVAGYIQRYLEEGFSPSLLQDYVRFLKHQEGDILSVRNGQEVIEGIFRGIDEEGALNIEVSGLRQRITSGELEHKPSTVNALKKAQGRHRG